MLAIAAKSFAATSETFIRDHARVLAPGETILLCQHGGGSDQFGCAVLPDIAGGWVSGNSAVARFANAALRSWRQNIHPVLSARKRRRIRNFFEVHRPHAVLAEYGPVGCAVMDACEEASVPLYVHFHGYDANSLPGKSPIRLYYRRLFAKATGFIVTSEFLRARLLQLGCPPQKLHVCPCGVDAERFAPAPGKNSAKRIVMVSRLVAQKGPLESIRSFAAALRRHPDAVLEIIGDGPLLERAKKEAARLKLDEHVVFHGAQPHDVVLSRLRAADMLIQHCRTRRFGGAESLGLTLIEAMSCGIPVVSTRHGAIPTTVEDGVTGVLVEEGDIEGMAEAITYLLDNPAYATMMGQAGRRRVLQHFTIDRSRNKLLSIVGLPQLQSVTC